MNTSDKTIPIDLIDKQRRRAGQLVRGHLGLELELMSLDFELMHSLGHEQVKLLNSFMTLAKKTLAEAAKPKLDSVVVRGPAIFIRSREAKEQVWKHLREVMSKMGDLSCGEVQLTIQVYKPPFNPKTS